MVVAPAAPTRHAGHGHTRRAIGAGRPEAAAAGRGGRRGAVRAATDERVDRADLLWALEEGWGRYLAGLRRLSPTRQAAFARLQGFPHLGGLLAHLCAWWERTLQVVAAMGGADVPHHRAPHGAAGGGADTCHRGRGQAELEEEFERLRAALTAVIRALPERVLADSRVSAWLYESVVEHYAAHRPPCWEVG